MIASGNAIKNDIVLELKKEVVRFHPAPRLGIVYVGDDPVIDRYIALKEKCAKEIGVSVQIKKFDTTVSHDDLVRSVTAFCGEVDGLIVQLPLPVHIRRDEILELIPPEKDVDMLSSVSRQLFIENKIPIVPPVVGAIVEIFERYAISLVEKKIVVVGRGHLVGAPFVVWLTRKGITPTVITRTTPNIEGVLRDADIIVTGVGQPGLITPDMIKTGAVLIDAGTSESEGALQGDIDPECAHHAGLFTPVPGGVGPITVAMIFKNLFALLQSKNER
jgi:methylenetetrahydrofolate dehydrogenase (NADP+)/methenyltetrahydrofolate cyclohydrolase